jgi:hypothetical protein
MKTTKSLKGLDDEDEEEGSSEGEEGTAEADTSG